MLQLHLVSLQYCRRHVEKTCGNVDLHYEALGIDTPIADDA